MPPTIISAFPSRTPPDLPVLGTSAPGVNYLHALRVVVTSAPYRRAGTAATAASLPCAAAFSGKISTAVVPAPGVESSRIVPP